MKVLGLIGVFILVAACNNAAPTATVYKEQLGNPKGAAPGGNTGTGNATPGATSGNPALGLSAFTSNCVGCHAFGGALNLDSTKDIAGSASKAAHSGVTAIFTASAGDIGAMLKGNAANGDSVMTAKCGGCHNGTVQVALDSFAALDGQDKSANHPGALGTDIGTNLADIAAALAKK